MSTQPKKTALARLRAEKERRKQEFNEGCELVEGVAYAFFNHYKTAGNTIEDFFEGLLIQADRAYELLRHHSTHLAFRHLLLERARIYSALGQQTMAVADLRRADELFIAA